MTLCRSQASGEWGAWGDASHWVDDGLLSWISDRCRIGLRVGDNPTGQRLLRRVLEEIEAVACAEAARGSSQ